MRLDRILLILVAALILLGLGVWYGARSANHAQPVQLVEPDGTTVTVR